MDQAYSLRHLGLFSKPLLTITEKGFLYKETLYTRDDVTKVIVVGGGGCPKKMGVHLADRSKIFINAGALELNGGKPKTGFFSGTNEVFEGL